MAECWTSGDGKVRPQVKLSVWESSSDGATVTLSWKLEWVTYGYTANTNGQGRSWSVKIDGSTVQTGAFNIDGRTSATIASGTKSVSRTHASRSVSFSMSFNMDVTWSGTYCGNMTGSGSISIGAKSSYTVSYNANGGAGAPGDQTKWYGETLTLSSAKPSRDGHTFKGWATSAGGGVAYASGANYTSNSGVTLYAVWQINTWIVSYNANGGSGAPGNQTKTYGQTLKLSTTKPTKTGYTFKGWATSTSGSVAYASGADYTNDSSATLYAVWSENHLTVNYYSNYADYCTVEGTQKAVSATTNVKVLTVDYYYDNAYTNGLNDIQNKNSLYLSRTRYDSTGYWGTALEVEIGDSTSQIINASNGIAVRQDKSFASGQELAEAFGKSLKTGNASVNIYAQWVLLCSRITLYDQDGNGHRGMVHIYDDDGNMHYGIITIYDSNGNARVVI